MTRSCHPGDPARSTVSRGRPASRAARAAAVPVPLPARARVPRDGTFANPVLDTGPGRDHGDPFVLRHGRPATTCTTPAPRGSRCGPGRPDHWSPAGPRWSHRTATTGRRSTSGRPRSCTPTASSTCTSRAPGTSSVGRARTPGVGVDSGDDRLRRQGIARASDPLGPFVLDPAPLLDVWSIDGHPFVDVDGRRWLFYNVRDESTRYRGTVPGCGNLVDELVAPDAVSGRPTPVTLPDAAWEGRPRRHLVLERGSDGAAPAWPLRADVLRRLVRRRQLRGRFRHR